MIADKTNGLDTTVIVTALNETWSLEKTIDVVIEENKPELKEIIIVISPKTTTPECKDTIQSIISTYGDIVRVYEQIKPHLGGAITECIENSNGKYTLIMAGDLETDPYLVKNLIANISQKNVDLVTTSRWLKGGDFKNYNKLKYCFNYIFQKIFSFLYGVSLTDMTFGYRIFRTDKVNQIDFKELKHPFFLESIIKPVRLGFKIIEIPAKWERRGEGESTITLKDFFGYFRVGFCVLFTAKKKLIKSNFLDINK